MPEVTGDDRSRRLEMAAHRVPARWTTLDLPVGEGTRSIVFRRAARVADNCHRLDGNCGIRARESTLVCAGARQAKRADIGVFAADSYGDDALTRGSGAEIEIDQVRVDAR